MILVKNDSNNPYFNLAVEEYFLKQTEAECFILWQNKPCIVIGKNQNAHSEINIDYVKENEIIVVRRLSGGGAVFHDLGNINFTFITHKGANDEINFSKFTLPIIEALKDLSIHAEFSGRNDILIDGKKFSGNAQYYHKNRVLHHGTLLFSGNLSNLSQALRPKPQKFEDKAVKSVVSRVTNISHHLQKPMTVLEFKDFLESHIQRSNHIAQVYTLTPEDVTKIEALVQNRYAQWDWNFGQSPEYQLRNEKKCRGGTLEIRLDVEKGLIQKLKIYGDYFAKKDTEEIETALLGVRHQEEAVREALEGFDFNAYFMNIDLDEFVPLLF